MPKPIEIPPAAAKAFVRDLRAFFAAGHDTIKADVIAAREDSGQGHDAQCWRKRKGGRP